jgi:hypothetical protein
LLDGDNSNYKGEFTQTEGTTIVGENGSMFTGTSTISNSLLEIRANDDVNYKLYLGTGSILNYSCQCPINISSSMDFTGRGGEAVFKGLPGSGTSIHVV